MPRSGWMFRRALGWGSSLGTRPQDTRIDAAIEHVLVSDLARVNVVDVDELVGWSCPSMAAAQSCASVSITVGPSWELSEYAYLVVAEVLGENLSTLLGVVVGHSVDGLAGDRLQRDLRLEALLAYMRRNCSDPDLSPSAAAAHLRISVRTVHKLMKQTERSLGEWLLDERLHHCVHMLQDPAQLRRKISDIAWTCGFNDLSHFNNVFRSRFARTPSDLRRAATTADRSDLHADFRPGFPNARDEDNSYLNLTFSTPLHADRRQWSSRRNRQNRSAQCSRARRMTVLAWLK
jgi:AraC-like DNA-binding protein